jgi:hypothetical protein
VFDLVNHEILITKLSFCWNSRNSGRLVQVISDRKQKTNKIECNPNSYSDWETIKHGVLRAFTFHDLYK